MQGEIVRIYDSDENGNKAGRVKTASGIQYNIYQLPLDVQIRDRVGFSKKRSQAGNEYGIFESRVDNYFDIYGEDAELEAIEIWIDTINGLRNRVRDVVKGHQVGHDYIIFHDDGSQTLVEVKNEENYWYERTGNITIDAISAFTIENGEVQEYLTNNRNWIAVEYYQRFIEGINIMRKGSLYESDADIMVKRIIGGDFVKGYDMQHLKQEADRFEALYRLRVNAKEDYGIEENWESATYCIPPRDLQDYEINNYNEIPKRKR